jgi:hypothetical protein
MARQKVSDSDLPEKEQALLKEVRGKHAELVAGFNKVLKEVGLDARINGFRLVSGSRAEGDDVDHCCMTCVEPDGPYEHCCDFENCATCCY